MRLPPLMRARQRLLFDKVQLTPHSARNWVGDFYEEATASLTRGCRYRDSAAYEICPDVGVGYWFFESKAVGRSGTAIVYQGRLAKDRRLVVESGRDLFYCLWQHNFATATAQTREELYAALSRHTLRLVIVPLATIENYCLSRPVKVLNTGYTKTGAKLKYGSSEKGYGWGWAIPVRRLLASCTRQVVVPTLPVYDSQLPSFPVHTCRELDGLPLTFLEDLTMVSQQKLRSSLNAYVDGDVQHTIVGFGFSEFQDTKQPAIFLIFADNKGMLVSVNLPEQPDALGEGEFFLKDWAEALPAVERLLENDILQLSSKPRVAATNERLIAIASVNQAKLTAFTAAELQQYTPRGRE